MVSKLQCGGKVWLAVGESVEMAPESSGGYNDWHIEWFLVTLLPLTLKYSSLQYDLLHSSTQGYKAWGSLVLKEEVWIHIVYTPTSLKSTFVNKKRDMNATFNQ